MMTKRALFPALLATLIVSGCADLPTFGARAPGGTTPPANADHPRAESLLAREPAREPAREAQRDAAQTLREGIRLYNNGDFNAAIAKLGAPEIQSAPGATRVAALKYTAFSYCVTARPVQCRQAFDKILRIDANFELAPGEDGHPMWGPVFDKAKGK